MTRLIKRTAWVAVLIILITGTIASALGLYDYRKRILDTAEAEFYFRNYSLVNVIQGEIPEGDEEYLEACVGLAFTEEDDVRAAWLYNTETGRVSCAEGNRYAEEYPEFFFDSMPDGKILEEIRLGRTVKYKLRDGAQYSYWVMEPYRLILLHDVQEYQQDIRETVRSTVRLSLLVGAVTAVIILLFQLIPANKVRNVLSMAVLFLGITGISVNMFLSAYQMYAEHKKEFNGLVLGYIEEDITGFLELSEDEAAEHCRKYFPEKELDGRDVFRVLAECYAGLYEDGRYITSIRVNDNILDFSLPMEDRAEISWTGNENELVECVIRAVTIGILALVLYYEWTDSRKKSTAYGGGTEMRAYQGVVAFIGLSAGLVKAILVVTLSEIAKKRGFSLTTAITVATVVITIAFPLKSPLCICIMKHLKSFRMLLLINTAALFAGLLLCGFSDRVVFYLIGLVLFQLCSGSDCTFGGAYWQIKSGSAQAYKAVKDIAVSYYGGRIIGMIITGIIAGMISSRTLFFLAAGISLISLALCSGCRIEAETTDLVSMDLKKLFTGRRLRILFLLIPVLSGVLNYYYDYALPIAVDNLMFSAGTISSLYLLRELGRYAVKYLKINSALKKLKLTPRNKAVLYFLIKASALLLLLIYSPTIVTIAVMMVLFGLADGFLKGGIRGETNSKLNDTRTAVGYNDLINTATTSGDFLASLSVQAGLPVSVIPGLLIVSPVLYWLLTRNKGQKVKKQS